MIEMSIESIRVSLRNYQRVVILREKGSDRYLPIWIGAAEADAIAVRLQEHSVARPLTHDLLNNLIGEFGGSVQFVVINDLENDTFYAKITVEHDGRTLEVDSRPSDAIALAVRAGVPIYAEESVLARAGVLLNADGEPVDAADQPPGVTAEELEKLSVFSEFIDELDLDTLGDAEGEGEGEGGAEGEAPTG